MTFARRMINVTASNLDNPSDTVQMTNHRVIAAISLAGDPAYGSAQVSVYGMTLDLMNHLSTYGQPIHPQYRYRLTVEAGDDVNGMSTVFIGDINQAWADFQAMPDVPFHFIATSSGVPGVQRSAGGSSDYTSYSGATDAKTILQKLAGDMGLQAELDLVSVMLSNPYYFGSPMRQAQLVREAADLMMVIENGVLAAWPADQSRPGGNYVISKSTGMIAAPSFTESGILVRAEFTKYANYGTEMTIQTELIPKANGQWTIIKAEYDLQANVPNGHWFVALYGNKNNAGMAKL